MIEKYKEFLKKISEESSILFDELCEQTGGENIEEDQHICNRRDEH